MVAEQKALAIAPRTLQQVARHEAPDIFQTGELLARSGYFADAREAAQAFVKVLAGRELGIGDIAAMTGIYIVKGKVSLSANLMAALVKRSGRYDYRIKRLDDRGCEVEFFEQGASLGVSAFTEDDARKAQLAGGDNWKKFPRNMYFARAMSNGVKFYCPDVSMAPIYTPEELGEQVDEETGEIIEARPVATAIAQTAERPQPSTPTPAENHATPERRELLEQVTARCIELGYDTAKQLKARAHAAKKTDAQLRDEAIPSLDKLIEARHKEETRLRTAIYHELNTLYKSDAEITAFLKQNAGGTEPKVMPLEDLKKLADMMEIK